MIFLVFQNLFFNVVFRIFADEFVKTRELELGLHWCDLKVFGKSFYIFLGHFNAWIAAAISGTFGTVIVHFGIFHSLFDIGAKC